MSDIIVTEDMIANSVYGDYRLHPVCMAVEKHLGKRVEISQKDFSDSGYDEALAVVDKSDETEYIDRRENVEYIMVSEDAMEWIWDFQYYRKSKPAKFSIKDNVLYLGESFGDFVEQK